MRKWSTCAHECFPILMHFRVMGTTHSPWRVTALLLARCLSESTILLLILCLFSFLFLAVGTGLRALGRCGFKEMVSPLIWAPQRKGWILWLASKVGNILSPENSLRICPNFLRTSCLTPVSLFAQLCIWRGAHVQCACVKVPAPEGSRMHLCRGARSRWIQMSTLAGRLLTSFAR